MARPLKHMHGLRIRTLVLPSRSKKRMPTWRYSEFLTNLKRILEKKKVVGQARQPGS